jgi:hypothetical protein
VKFGSRFLLMTILISLTACGGVDNFAKFAIKRTAIVATKKAVVAAEESARHKLSVTPKCYIDESKNCSSAQLSNRTLSDLDLSNAIFDQADLSKADLSKSDLRGSSFVGTDLTEANLSGALTDGVDLEAANLSGATMPDGTIHD